MVEQIIPTLQRWGVDSHTAMLIRDFNWMDFNVKVIGINVVKMASNYIIYYILGNIIITCKELFNK